MSELFLIYECRGLLKKTKNEMKVKCQYRQITPAGIRELAKLELQFFECVEPSFRLGEVFSPLTLRELTYLRNMQLRRKCSPHNMLEIALICSLLSAPSPYLTSLDREVSHSPAGRAELSSLKDSAVFNADILATIDETPVIVEADRNTEHTGTLIEKTYDILNFLSQEEHYLQKAGSLIYVVNANDKNISCIIARRFRKLIRGLDSGEYRCSDFLREGFTLSMVTKESLLTTVAELYPLSRLVNPLILSGILTSLGYSGHFRCLSECRTFETGMGAPIRLRNLLEVDGCQICIENAALDYGAVWRTVDYSRCILFQQLDITLIVVVKDDYTVCTGMGAGALLSVAKNNMGETYADTINGLYSSQRNVPYKKGAASIMFITEHDFLNAALIKPSLFVIAVNQFYTVTGNSRDLSFSSSTHL